MSGATGAADEVDLLVVGGGPAGLACATTAAGLGLRTVLAERLALGGELAMVTMVAGLPGRSETSGADLAADLTDEVLAAGVDVRFEEVESIEVRDELWYAGASLPRARSLVLAAGAELDLQHIPGGTPHVGRGVSGCSSCDGPLFRDRKVAVVGNGERTARMALELATFATSVTVLPPDGLQVSPATASRLAEVERIDVRAATRVLDVTGDPLAGLVLGAARDSTALGGTGQDLALDGVFVGTRRRPEAHLLADARDDEGAVRVDDRLRVAAPGVPPLLAIGDVRSGSSATVAGALGDGVAAAWTVAARTTGVLA